MLGLAALAIGANAQAPELKQQPYQAARVNWSSTSAQAPLPAWGDAVLYAHEEAGHRNNNDHHDDRGTRTHGRRVACRTGRKVRARGQAVADSLCRRQPGIVLCKVRLGSREIVLAPNSGFYDSVPESIAKTLPAWLRDVQVGEISPLGLKLNAGFASPKSALN